MCGIVGQVAEPGAIQEEAVVRLRDVLVHRGPDDAGVYVSPDRSVGLGHRRLSIIDLSSAGHQPMSNRTGTVWLVFNGEIYNFRELRRELERGGHTFRSGTDTEAIIHAYEEWGLDSVRHLRGMFAYALWDTRTRVLVLVRDRLGIKPLYYWHRGHDLTFGSELRAVVADARVPKRVDETAVYDFFTYQYVPSPKSIYADVRKLPAGHYAVYRDGALELVRYWDLEPRAQALSEADAVAELRTRLADVVGMHLVADVPVGVLLSGGVDSSAVTAMAVKSASAAMETFTVGFDVHEHSEARYAEQVARRLGTRHHELTVTRGMALETANRVIDLYDEPYADGSAIPTLLVSQLARTRVTVALSGEGGDEVFGGYQWYGQWLRLEGRLPLPAGLRRTLFGIPARLLPRGARGQWTFAMKAAPPLDRYARLMGAFLGREKTLVLAPDFLRRFDGYDTLWHYRQFWRPDLPPMLRLQYLDLKTYLPDDLLTKFDRATMQVALEGRVPLLDHELVEFVLGLPAAIRNPGHRPKHLLKLALADVLPDTVLERRKQGFSVPWYAWLAEGAGPLLDQVHDGVLHPDVKQRSAAFPSEDLWRLIVMNGWLATHAA